MVDFRTKVNFFALVSPSKGDTLHVRYQPTAIIYFFGKRYPHSFMLAQVCGRLDDRQYQLQSPV